MLTAVEGDLRVFSEAHIGSGAALFDRVMLDAPCSGEYYLLSSVREQQGGKEVLEGWACVWGGEGVCVMGALWQWHSTLWLSGFEHFTCCDVFK